MESRRMLTTAVVLSALSLIAAKPAPRLSSVTKAPAGLSSAVTAAISPQGHRISSDGKTICEIWTAKKLPLKQDFKPTLSVKYPMTQGQFVGVLRVAPGETFTDFRAQEIKPGVYTLRYGKQPEDGNHLGTSELADFLVAIPAKYDKNPKRIRTVERLYSRSAKASGSTHPAIFSLLPSKKTDTAALAHDKDNDLWVLNLTAVGSSGTKKVSVPIRLVVIGHAEE